MTHFDLNTWSTVDSMRTCEWQNYSIYLGYLFIDFLFSLVLHTRVL